MTIRPVLAAAALVALLAAPACSGPPTFSQGTLEERLVYELAVKGYPGETVTCPVPQDRADSVTVCRATGPRKALVVVTRDHDRTGWSWALTPAPETTGRPAPA